MLNSYLVFKNTEGTESLSRAQFLMSVIEVLCSVEEPAPTAGIGTAAAVLSHHLKLLDAKKERDCAVCNKRSKDKKTSAGRKRTRYWCPACNVGCHQHYEPALVHETGRGNKRQKHDEA